MPEIIILACVALFVGLRLYSVLGRRTGAEQQPIAKPADAPRSPLVARRVDPVADAKPVEGGQAAALAPDAVDGIRQVVTADSHFDVSAFLDGARSAYAQALEAFWAGDVATLEKLCAPDVLASFVEAIEARREAGETLENRLVAIERATVDSAVVSGKQAVITVRFEADIAAITRDAEGNVVGGSMSDAVQTRDLWTFGRTLRSDDPNWLLIETDEAA